MEVQHVGMGMLPLSLKDYLFVLVMEIKGEMKLNSAAS